MGFDRKILKIFFTIFFALYLASCKPGCVEPDEFDVQNVEVKANPIQDGVYGNYDSVTGGQRAEWHDTGLRSNGEPFVIKITGGWTPWNKELVIAEDFDELPLANICSKKEGVDNCLCHPGQTPEIVPILSGGQEIDSSSVDCTSNTTDQDNPSVCTCTPNHGSPFELDVYHFTTDYRNPGDETIKLSDNHIRSRFNAGMGLYLGLFGSDGTTIPLRAYHLFTSETTCDIKLNSEGLCKDDDENDRTSYVYRSANNKIFVRDDQAGNDGIDTDAGDDIFHEPNEIIKLMIRDRYYYDNYGSYNVKFIRGVGNDKDDGLIEYIVRNFESVVLGEINEDGQREGSIIEFMYKSIVQDSGFILALRGALVLYIAFYGVAVSLGIAQVSKKELMSRIVKIGLIVMFTSESSWVFYNNIIVGFFKDSMDYVVSMIMTLFDGGVAETSMIAIAQMDRAVEASNATRFAYVDLIIKKMLSMGTTKKIFGLFFGDLFGIIYIPAIYFLIGFFIYVMLFVATAYLVNVLKIIFVLSLGPIFMSFTLFSSTSQMFKQWIAFLGARSLEIIMLFAILYNFLGIIDRSFNEMLNYSVCSELWGLENLFKFGVLKSDIDRSLVEWIVMFVEIGGLIFITKLVIDKVPDLAGYLIKIGDVSNKNSQGGGIGASGFKLAGGMMGEGLKLMREGAGAGLSAAKTAVAGEFGLVKGLTELARRSGAADKFNALGKKIPFRGPRTAIRDRVIADSLKIARREANSQGLKGKEADAAIRQRAVKDLQSKMYRNPNRMGALGVDMNNIAKRLDKVLTEDALKKHLTSEARKLKNLSADKIPLTSKEIRSQLAEGAKKWADENLSRGSKSIEGYLENKSMRDLMKKEATLTSDEAAKKFAGNDKAQNRYLQHLQDKEFRKAQKDQDLKDGIFTKHKRLARNVRAGYRSLKRDHIHNPKMMQENFMRKVMYKEQQSLDHRKHDVARDKDGNKKISLRQLGDNVFAKNASKGWDPLKRVNILNQGAFSQEKDQKQRELMRSRLRNPSLDQKQRDYLSQKLAEREDQRTKEEMNRLQEDKKMLENARELGKERKETNDKLLLLKTDLDAESAGYKLTDDDKTKKQEELARYEKELAEKDNQIAPIVKSIMNEGSSDLTGIEKQARLEAIEKALELRGENERQEILIEAKKEIATIQAKAQAKAQEEALAQVEKAAKALQESLDNAEAKKEYEEAISAPLIANDFKIEFGANASDALLKEMDVGIKAGNILLGDNSQGGRDSESDKATLISHEMDKNQSSGRLKIAKIDKKIKEMELANLKSKTPDQISDSEKSQMISLEREITDLDSKINKFDLEVKKIDDEINSINNRINSGS